MVISVWNRENFGFEEFMIGRKEAFWEEVWRKKVWKRGFANGAWMEARSFQVFKFGQ